LLFSVVNNNIARLSSYFYSKYRRVILFFPCLVQINLTNVTTVRIIDQKFLIVKFSTQVNQNKNSTELYFKQS
jgi:hypothetical protein